MSSILYNVSYLGVQLGTWGVLLVIGLSIVHIHSKQQRETNKQTWLTKQPFLQLLYFVSFQIFVLLITLYYAILRKSYPSLEGVQIEIAYTIFVIFVLLPPLPYFLFVNLQFSQGIGIRERNIPFSVYIKTLVFSTLFIISLLCGRFFYGIEYFDKRLDTSKLDAVSYSQKCTYLITYWVAYISMWPIISEIGNNISQESKKQQAWWSDILNNIQNYSDGTNKDSSDTYSYMQGSESSYCGVDDEICQTYVIVPTQEWSLQLHNPQSTDTKAIPQNQQNVLPKVSPFLFIHEQLKCSLLLQVITLTIILIVALITGIQDLYFVWFIHFNLWAFVVHMMVLFRPRNDKVYVNASVQALEFAKKQNVSNVDQGRQ